MGRCQAGNPPLGDFPIHTVVFMEDIFAVAFLLEVDLVMRPDLVLFTDDFRGLSMKVVMCRTLSADRLEAFVLAADFGPSRGNPTIFLIS